MSTNSSTPVITKDSKKKIKVDYEGKLSFKERLKRKLAESNTWIKAGVTVLRFILMLGISFVIIRSEEHTSELQSQLVIS